MRAGALDICALGAIDMPPCKQLDICPHADNRYSHVKCERKRILRIYYILNIIPNVPNGGEWCSLTQPVTETDRRILNVRN